MKKGILNIMIVTLLCVGCGQQAPKYKSNMTVTPTGIPHEYVAKCEIVGIAPETKGDVLGAPGITLLSGKETKSQIADATEANGVFFTVLVEEVGSGVKSSGHVVLKRNGKVVFEERHLQDEKK